MKEFFWSKHVIPNWKFFELRKRHTKFTNRILLWFLKNRPIKIKALFQKPTSAWSSSWTCCCFGPRPSVCRTRSSLWDSFPGAVWLVFAEFLFFFFLRFPCSLFVGFIKKLFIWSAQIINGCASFRWSFGPLFARGSKESTTILATILATHPNLE